MKKTREVCKNDMVNALNELRKPDTLYLSDEIKYPAIYALVKTQEYMKIGTIEQCRAAMNCSTSLKGIAKTGITEARLQEYQLMIGMSQTEDMYSKNDVMNILRQLEKDIKTDTEVEKLMEKADEILKNRKE